MPFTTVGRNRIHYYQSEDARPGFSTVVLVHGAGGPEGGGTSN